MILIIGGAYQGKLDFAKTTLGIEGSQVYTCTGREIDFSLRCVDHLEEFAYACVQAGLDPIARFRESREQWRDSVLICQDVFCGVVPMDPVQRQWRQVTGRLCQYLAGEADRVSRVFCGLEQRLK